MTAGHGETETQKPISEYAKYIKNLIPVNIPESYALKPMFRDVAGEENMRYGCDRKLRNERCQGGCRGIRIPLDDSILDIKREIEIWLENEVPCP